MIAAGKLQHRVTIQRPGAPTQDPVTGEITQPWIDLASPEVWAAIEPLSARDFIAAKAAQSEMTARITIRWRGDVDATCRLLHVKQGRTMVYEIVNGDLSDKESGLEYLTLPVRTGVWDGE